jgi:hypothetical protein
MTLLEMPEWQLMMDNTWFDDLGYGERLAVGPYHEALNSCQWKKCEGIPIPESDEVYLCNLLDAVCCLLEVSVDTPAGKIARRLALETILCAYMADTEQAVSNGGKFLRGEDLFQSVQADVWELLPNLPPIPLELAAYERPPELPEKQLFAEIFDGVYPLYTEIPATLRLWLFGAKIDGKWTGGVVPKIVNRLYKSMKEERKDYRTCTSNLDWHKPPRDNRGDNSKLEEKLNNNARNYRAHQEARYQHAKQERDRLEMRELVDCACKDNREREIVSLTIDGHDGVEIAAQVKKHPSTVSRLIKGVSAAVRKKLDQIEK